MMGGLWLNKCQICHWRVSSLRFLPNGCNVLALFIKWASRAFLTESWLLRMSSIGMRRTSLIEWPAWLKCSDTGVVVLCFWWFRIERRCSPERSKSWRLVSPMYWCIVTNYDWWHLLHSIRYMRFFERPSVNSVNALGNNQQLSTSTLVAGMKCGYFSRFSSPTPSPLMSASQAAKTLISLWFLIRGLGTSYPGP